MITWRHDIGLWWPEQDKDPVNNYNFAMKKVTDSDLAVRLCKERRVCVQAGGWVGLWPARLARSFATVLTHEIQEACYRACVRNCALLNNVVVYPAGLSDTCGAQKVRVAPSAGSWRVAEDGTETAGFLTVDALELSNLDALILDVEGHEPAVLRGAAASIKRFKPVIMVEELPRVKDEIRDLIKSFGYRPVTKVHGDVIYVPLDAV